MEQSTKKRILICEDHTIIIDGLKLLFSNHPTFELIGYTTVGLELASKIKSLSPEILILDLNLKDIDGLTLLREIRKITTTMKVVILTMYHDEFLIESAQKGGANAYLQKNVSNEELLNALSEINNNSFYLSKTLKEEANRRKIFRDYFVNKMKLTKRELELVPLFANGKTSTQIADQLSISPLTIDTHRKNIFRKLEINSIIELVNFAHENSLL